MRILFLTRFYWPHVGGVEKHVAGLSREMIKRGNDIAVLTERYDSNLKSKELKNNTKIIRFNYPHIKFIGLLYIWYWLFKNRSLIERSDIIHCHDVFVWYLPFRFLYPGKPVYTTFHGWEGVYPIPWKNVVLKRLSAWLSWGNICVGEYIEKYYGIKADNITYGAVKIPKRMAKKEDKILFLGRLAKDTGLPKFLEFLKEGSGGIRSRMSVDFCGDGPMASICSKYGIVHGFIDPSDLLSKAKICVPTGYLSALEAFANKCQVLVFFENPLKRDYWEMTPFYKFIESKDTRRAFEWTKKQSWEKLADLYISLWKL